MYLRRISAALTKEQKLDVVSVADVKAQAHITHAEEDSLIETHIEAAYDYLSGESGWLGRCCLLEEEFEVTFLDLGQHCGSELEMRPFAGSALIGFDALDATGIYVAIDPARFRLVPGATFWSLYRGTAWASPSVRPINPAAFRVRFRAGFGAASDVPSTIKLAIKMLAGHWFANREATSSDTRAVPRVVELGLKNLCGRYRISPDHS